jgi:transcriptional regulator GlxA family with amidase domain
MWEPHGRRILSPDNRVVVANFVPSFLGGEMLGEFSWVSLFSAQPSIRPRVTAAKLRREVLRLGLEMEQEIEGKRLGWESAFRLSVLRLLLMLRRSWEPPALPSRTLPNPAGSLSRIMPAMALIHEDPSRPAGVSEAAARCGLSGSRFSVIFREVMGTGFHRFCLRSRLAVAARLLLATDRPIGSIARATGFVDGSHLHRAFLKQYHRTPGSYRAQAI